MARVFNLTPHDVHIYKDGVDEPMVILSDGELRLKSRTPVTSLSHIHPLHYYRSDGDHVTEGAIPIIHAQVFTGLDETSPGFKIMKIAGPSDSIIVSMPVAHWLTNTDHRSNILSPGTGPTSVVRFTEGDRKGQVKGVRALEYHEKQYSDCV